MSQRELARTLKLSPGTVNHHLRSLGSHVVVSRSPVRIDGDALEQLAGLEPAPTPPPVGTRPAARSVRVDEMATGPADLLSAAALAQELCDTLKHAAALAERLSQMGFDLPGVARSDRATVRDGALDGPRDADRASSRGAEQPATSGAGSETPASTARRSADPGSSGAREPRERVRDVAQPVAQWPSTAGTDVSPGQEHFPDVSAVREPRDASRGLSSSLEEERKKDLLSFSSPSGEKQPRETTSRDVRSSRDEVRKALEPLIEQCRRCSKPYSIDNNGVKVLQAIPVANLEHAVQQLCRQIRTDPSNNVRSPLGLLVSKAYEGDEMMFAIAQPEPEPSASPQPSPAVEVVDEPIEEVVTLKDLWLQLDDEQRSAIDNEIENGKFKDRPNLAHAQKLTLAAGLLGIDLAESSAA